MRKNYSIRKYANLWVKDFSSYCRRRARAKIKDLGYNFDKGEMVHHIDKNPTNNHIMNLLVVTPIQHIGLHGQISSVEKYKEEIGILNLMAQLKIWHI